MARSPTTRPTHRFDFLGFLDGWYALRMDMAGHPDALTFENSVVEWLVETQITPNTLSHVGNGNTGDGPWLPALADGSGLCVLLLRPADVLRFARQFPCRGITAESVYAAVNDESLVARLWYPDIALVAYDAVRRFNLVHRHASQPWENVAERERRTFLEDIIVLIDSHDKDVTARHEAWMARRWAQGWRFGRLDLRARTHPAMVPFNKLSKVEHARHRMLCGIVDAMLPLTAS